MNTGRINQKEYVKKYLSGDRNESKKKKKKRDKSTTKTTITIVDDDIDLSQLANATEAELDNYNLGEDLPQIAGIIDERPAELIAKEDYKTSGKWKSVGDDGNGSTKLFKKYDLSNKVVSGSRSPDASPQRRTNRNRDFSPPKRSNRSPDASPPRHSQKNSNSSHSKRSHRSRDGSPSRRSHRSPDVTRTKRSNRSPDFSPPRRSNRSPDASPPKRSNHSPNASPRKHSHRNSNSSHSKRSYRSRDSSPSRRSHPSPDISPPRRSNRNPNVSPPRRPNQNSNSSQSKHSHRSDSYPSRNSDERLKPIKKSSDSPPPAHRKMVKTLEGKVAGLQDAKALREENEQFRKREEEIFEKIQEKQKYEDNRGVVHDRKTGRHRRLHEEDKKDSEKLKKEEERRQVYELWGKGLKQIENYKEQMASENHEMNKPMARYANDADLENYLRNQCRDGDPMASYFRKKTTELQSGPSKPIYQGSFPENRFNIRPGYRWDGVDRSNGYEKKWFNVLNQKKAVEEEAYKYSVEDM